MSGERMAVTAAAVERPISGTATLYNDGTGFDLGVQDVLLTFDPAESPSFVQLNLDIDLGVLAQEIGIDLDLRALLTFARSVENHGRIHVGEHVLDLGQPGGGRRIVREVIDEQTVLLGYETGAGTYRSSVAHLHRLFREETPS